MMRSPLGWLILILALDPGVAAGEAPWLGLVPDTANGVYVAKTKATFTLTALGGTGKDATLGYRLVWNQTKELAKGEVKLKNGTATVTQELPEPGCLACEVTLGVQKAEVGVVADPFKIAPSRPAPKDFDAFWAAEKAALAKVPMNPRLLPATFETKATYGPEVECFDLTLDCTGGRPVRGYFARPKGAKPKSLPAHLSLHSAGIRDSSLQAAWYQAKNGRIALDINAHGLDNGKPAEFYNGLRDGELKGYQSMGIDSRDSFYFKGMYLRIVRAIDFLASQPEWDGRILIVGGASQGGGQALVAAGIDPRVSELNAVVPAFCDLTGDQAGRQCGWPGNVAKTPAARATVGYFDAGNFAARFKGKSNLIVGLIDHTCPPTGVIAAFNQLGGDKTLVIIPSRGHGGDRDTAKLEKDPAFAHRP